MKKRDIIIVTVEIIVILAFFFFFYLNNKVVGATFLLPGATHFESCWQKCEYKCQPPCLEECCVNDQECLENMKTICQNNEVVQNG